jgi:hypothetical protein
MPHFKHRRTSSRARCSPSTSRWAKSCRAKPSPPGGSSCCTFRFNIRFHFLFVYLMCVLIVVRLSGVFVSSRLHKVCCIFRFLYNLFSGSPPSIFCPLIPSILTLPSIFSPPSPLSPHTRTQVRADGDPQPGVDGDRHQGRRRRAVAVRLGHRQTGTLFIYTYPHIHVYTHARACLLVSETM